MTAGGGAGKPVEISKEQVAHLCRLARVGLNPREAARLQGELSRILGYMRLLDLVETEGVDAMVPSVQLPGCLREDRLSGGVIVEDALRGAPERCGDFFVVPTVVELTLREDET